MRRTSQSSTTRLSERDVERRADAWTEALQIAEERREELAQAIECEARRLAGEIVRDSQELGRWIESGDLLPHEFVFHHPVLGRDVTLEHELVRLVAANVGAVQEAIIAALAERPDVREIARAKVLDASREGDPD